jgi:hypothetical protein
LNAFSTCSIRFAIRNVFHRSKAPINGNKCEEIRNGVKYITLENMYIRRLVAVANKIVIYEKMENEMGFQTKILTKVIQI